LSFVPDAEQRLWRTVTRKKYQLRCDRIRLQNQLESLLEKAHIKLSSLVSDLLGLSARRMVKAIAEGETNPATLAALADQRLRATPEQLCDARCVYGVERRLPAAAEDGIGGIAIDRRADRPTRPGNGQSAQRAPRCRSAAGGGTWSGSGLSTADHCRSRPYRGNLSLREMSLLVGRCLPGRRRERRRKLQPPLSKGQPSHATLTQSSCECRSQGQRKHLRDRVSPLGPAPGTQSSHRSHCPSTVSTDLADPAPRSPLRRTRPSGHQTIEATTHLEDDPPAPKPGLSD
jgi:hypothetical protein